MKHIFVINPRSFKDTTLREKVINEIVSCFPQKDSPDYLVYVSQFPREAGEVVRRFIESYPPDETIRVYAVGGDGIQYDCLNGMAEYANAELTCIPYGNANDYILSFGEDAIPKFRDIKNLVNGTSRPVDVITSGQNYSLLGISVGLIGETILLAEALFPRLPKKWLSKNADTAYTLCGVKSAFNKEVMQQHYNILIDGKDYSGQYCNLTISNSPNKGGGMPTIPYARPDDGKLDVLIFDTTKSFEFLKTIGDHNKGHFEKHKMYKHITCKEVDMSSGVLMRIETDGEATYSHELKIKILPDKIKFVTPLGVDFVDYSYKAYKQASQ